MLQKQPPHLQLYSQQDISENIFTQHSSFKQQKYDRTIILKMFSEIKSNAARSGEKNPPLRTVGHF
jgi:hypothetical protein